MSHLTGKRVAILAADGFEQSELLEPMRALKEHDATVDVVSPEAGKVQGFKHFEKGEQVAVDVKLSDAEAGRYDALVIPGGLFNPDTLRIDEKALAFTREFFKAGKPVAAICHGPWVLANAGVLEGRTVTSVPNIRKDLENAGAKWTDEEVVVDQGLVTSRTPDDLPAFCAKLIEEIDEGKHRGQQRSAA
ncbi:type 1 glutamine amidotransferase [Luteimonas viscosa]|uniref:Type 1 glutamine amidotransferase n=1 Tax=Luteimonas viscosa TaxID=1132694 RepID=A0A5D4XNI3_9GAMM|nr:type 1 glutamine amidotransferase domain-containing protein [Luteimonas viscosa]TYT26238.1 type 1 glutamine amidotransferase [Luteimonas viscosa]